MSGGLPHSEIRGSKPIPGFPRLIAGYHVLHRLLLPRHPPNALLALDLIQKKQGFSWCQKLVFPCPGGPGLVSVLTWKDCCPAGKPAGGPSRGTAGQRLVLLPSSRCQGQGREPALVERTGIEPVTS